MTFSGSSHEDGAFLTTTVATTSVSISETIIFDFHRTFQCRRPYTRSTELPGDLTSLVCKTWSLRTAEAKTSHKERNYAEASKLDNDLIVPSPR